MANKYKFERYDLPIAEPLIDELTNLWQSAFGDGLSWCRPVLSGGEREANRDILFLATADDQVVASCRLTINQRDPHIATLGEVATSMEHRGQGLATAVCSQAAGEFDRAGGLAMFLGTGNPNAARIYETSRVAVSTEQSGDGAHERRQGASGIPCRVLRQPARPAGQDRGRWSSSSHTRDPADPDTSPLASARCQHRHPILPLFRPGLL